MSIEAAVTKRLQDLVEKAEFLRQGNEVGQVFDEDRKHKCTGWLVSALNIVQILCPSESSTAHCD